MEFESVNDDHGCAVVTEVKYKKLRSIERRQLERHLADGWQRCALARRFREVRFEILNAALLKK